jgi:hypothetical protein
MTLTASEVAKSAWYGFSWTMVLGIVLILLVLIFTVAYWVGSGGGNVWSAPRGYDPLGLALGVFVVLLVVMVLAGIFREHLTAGFRKGFREGLQAFQPQPQQPGIQLGRRRLLDPKRDYTRIFPQPHQRTAAHVVAELDIARSRRQEAQATATRFDQRVQELKVELTRMDPNHIEVIKDQLNKARTHRDKQQGEGRRAAQKVVDGLKVKLAELDKPRQ